jgi:hypothetical protein
MTLIFVPTPCYYTWDASPSFVASLNMPLPLNSLFSSTFQLMRLLHVPSLQGLWNTRAENPYLEIRGLGNSQGPVTYGLHAFRQAAYLAGLSFFTCEMGIAKTCCSSVSPSGVTGRVPEESKQGFES